MKKPNTLARYIGYFVLLATLCSCASYNFYTPRHDQRLGDKMKREIESSPTLYPILAEADHQRIYDYVNGIVDTLLNTGLIRFKDEFAWEVMLLDDADVLNAFVAPGGYIYIYTGLIKYLESEDQLAGVIAHEMAHADLRHASRQMSQKSSLSTVLAVAGGATGTGYLTDIGSSLVSLKFSRSFEKEADRMAIRLLCATDYQADGLAGFFERLQSIGDKRPPAFLSTHPNPRKRVEKIKKSAAELNCQGSKTNRRTYQRMKRWLR
ncbi:MAG: M48 family metalloprotease [Saprospiraceae bacterium]|nr:M48 family metalloprotease [Saprospiraceae bacterium]